MDKSSSNIMINHGYDIGQITGSHASIGCHWNVATPNCLSGSYCKLEVPTILYKAYVRGYAPKIWPYMTYMEQYLHFRILKFPLINGSGTWWGHHEDLPPVEDPAAGFGTNGAKSWSVCLVSPTFSNLPGHTCLTCPPIGVQRSFCSKQ